MTAPAGGRAPAAAAARLLAAQLAASGSPDRAAGQAAYLKSSEHHLGVPVPQVRRVARGWLKVQRPDHDELLATVDALWRHRIDSVTVFECRLAAVELLHACPRLLDPHDLRTLEHLLRDCRTWALVDPLAGWVAGGIVRAHPEASLPVLDRWVTDDDFWVRRAALLGLGQLLADGVGQERLYAYATRLLPEREFFIRKAIGWVLREEARRNPGAVEAWLRAHMAEMNLVTLREPMRRFPPAVAAELRALYDTRR